MHHTTLKGLIAGGLVGLMAPLYFLIDFFGRAYDRTFTVASGAGSWVEPLCYMLVVLVFITLPCAAAGAFVTRALISRRRRKRRSRRRTPRP